MAGIELFEKRILRTGSDKDQGNKGAKIKVSHDVRLMEIRLADFTIRC